MCRNSNKGFSLTELLVALVVSGVLIIGVASGYVVNKRSYEEETGIRDMQMNAQVAMDRVKEILMTAGLGCEDNFPPLGSDTLQGKFRNASNVWTISNRTNGPDRLTVVTGLRALPQHGLPPKPAAVCQCQEEVPPTCEYCEGNVIDIGDATEFHTGTNRDQYLRYIFFAPSTENKYSTITAINGSQVALSGSTRWNHNDQVSRINAYTITLDQNPDGTPIDVDGDGGTSDDDNDRNSEIATYGKPVPDLYIFDNTDDLSDEAVSKVAEGIEDIQFQYWGDWCDANNNKSIDDSEWVNDATGNEGNIRAVRVYILARTLLPDPGYKDPNADPHVNPTAPRFMVADHQITLDTNDANGINSPFDQHYHRYLLQETVLVRNRNL